MILLLCLMLTGSSWVQDFFDQMKPGMVTTIRAYGKDFDITRHPGTAVRLLESYLEWRTVTLSENQRHLIATLALQLALDRAEESVEEFPEGSKDRDRVRFFIVLGRGILEERRVKVESKKWKQTELAFNLTK